MLLKSYPTQLEPKLGYGCILIPVAAPANRPQDQITLRLTKDEALELARKLTEVANELNRPTSLLEGPEKEAP